MSYTDEKKNDQCCRFCSREESKRYQQVKYRALHYEHPFAVGNTIALGEVISDTLLIEGETHIYVFNVNAGDYVYFDEQVNTTIKWKVTDVDGNIIFDSFLRNFPIFYDYDVGVYQLTRGGTYFMTVGGDNNEIGFYQF